MRYIPDPSLGGKAVVAKYGTAYMRQLGKKGLRALADKHFNGDLQAALTWLGSCGAYASDKVYREHGMGIMAEPKQLESLDDN